jgi:hypothetical protein
VREEGGGLQHEVQAMHLLLITTVFEVGKLRQRYARFARVTGGGNATHL